jgi:hypothetical protein
MRELDKFTNLNATLEKVGLKEFPEVDWEDFDRAEAAECVHARLHALVLMHVHASRHQLTNSRWACVCAAYQLPRPRGTRGTW